MGVIIIDVLGDEEDYETEAQTQKERTKPKPDAREYIEPELLPVEHELL